MRTVRRAMALALLMGAPVLAPVVLMNQALAQEGQNQQQAPAEQLDPELEQALAEALQGTPEQVQAQLQALLTNNPAQATAIANRARAVAPANVVAVVNNVTQTVINNQPAANNQANNQQGTEQSDNNQNQNQNQNPVAGNQLAGNNNQGTGNGQQGSSGGALVIPGSNGNGVVLNAVNFDQFQVAGGLAFLANNPTFVPGGTTQAPNFLVGPVFSNWLDRIDSTPVCFLGASSSINIGPYGSTTSPIRFNNGC